MTQTFKIPETIADKYHGCGYALASVIGGQVVNLIYLRDVIEEFDDEKDSLPRTLDDDRMGPSVRLLQSTGLVFVEL